MTDAERDDHPRDDQAFDRQLEIAGLLDQRTRLRGDPAGRQDRRRANARLTELLRQCALADANEFDED